MFGDLIRRFSNPVYSTIQHALFVKDVHLNDQNLEDLHNAVFVDLFENDCKKLSQYKGKNGCTLASWIRLVTARIVLNLPRKKGLGALGCRDKEVPIEDTPALIGNETVPWTVLENAGHKRLILEGMQHFSPRERLFIRLHFGRGFTMSETVEALRLPIQNIYTIKHRAIRRLKSYIKQATG